MRWYQLQGSLLGLSGSRYEGRGCDAFTSGQPPFKSSNSAQVTRWDSSGNSTGNVNEYFQCSVMTTSKQFLMCKTEKIQTQKVDAGHQKVVGPSVRLTQLEILIVVQERDALRVPCILHSHTRRLAHIPQETCLCPSSPTRI